MALIFTSSFKRVRIEAVLSLMIFVASNALASGSWEWDNQPWSDLNDIWGSSSTDIYVVGDNGLILHYDGTTWIRMESGTKNNLYGVHGVAGTPPRVFAVGEKGTVLRYTGHAWESIPTVNTDFFRTVTFNDVWCTPYHNRVIVVGNEGTIACWDDTITTGDRWWGGQVSWNPVGGAGRPNLNAVAGSPNSTDMLLSVGAGGVGYGPAFSIDPSPIDMGTKMTLEGVWVRSFYEIFAVGDYAVVRGKNAGDGKLVFEVLADRGGKAVWASSMTDVFVVGSFVGSQIRHYDGSTWTVMTAPTSKPLNGVWGSRADDVYAVGDAGTILHWNGLSWSLIRSGLTHQNLASMGATPSGNLLAAGESGTILRHDGRQWRRESTPATTDLKSVCAASRSEFFAVGSDGTILRDQGAGWFPIGSGTNKPLRGVWASSPNEVFVVGGGYGSPVALHFDGTAWSPMALPPDLDPGHPTDVSMVWGASSKDVFAVGVYTVLHFDGISWSRMQTPVNGYLFGIWGSSGSDVFAVGGDGLILHYDGTKWSQMTSGTTSWLQAVWGRAGNDVYAVGGKTVGNSIVLHYDGDKWSTIADQIPGSLVSLAGLPTGEVFAAGDGGAIWRSTEHNPPVFAHFVTGQMGALKNRTRIVLRNNGPTPDTGQIGLTNDQGLPAAFQIQGSAKAAVDWNLPGWGSKDIQTDGTGELLAGAIQVESSKGNRSNVEGTEVFEILGNYVSVADCPVRSSHQIYVARNSGENTGLAVYNNMHVEAVLDLTLLDQAGTVKATKEIRIAGRHHLARFVDEADLFKNYFDTDPANFSGTLNVVVRSGGTVATMGMIQKSGTSALIAMATSPNAYTPTTPGTSGAVGSAAVVLVFPQFADGTVQTYRCRTRIVLRNNSNQADSGQIHFLKSNGEPVTIEINKQQRSTLPYSLPAWGTLDFQTDGTGPLTTGAVIVTSSRGLESVLDGTEVFDLLGNYVSVESAPIAAQHQIYVSRDGTENAGMALYNPSSQPAVADVVLLDQAGASVATRILTLAPRQQLARFVNEPELFEEYFKSHPGDFRGTLNLRFRGGAQAAVLGLLQKSQGAMISVSTSRNPSPAAQ